MALAKEGQNFDEAPLAIIASDVIAVDSDTSSRPGWVRRLICDRTSQPTLLGHVVITGTLLAAAGVISAGLLYFASQKQHEWLSFDPNRVTLEQAQSLVGSVKSTPAERTRMVDQLMQVQQRIEVHSGVTGLFYKLNFMSLGMISVSVGIASVSLFFISKQGWEQSNNALINVFIVASSLVVFHSNLTLIFKYQDNISINQELLANYFDLRNIILSYWATQRTLEQSIPAAEFIYQVDTNLAELGIISLDFDADQAAQLREPVDYLPKSLDNEETSGN